MKKLELGIKSDPIHYRYSFDWLFERMNKWGIPHLQLGTFFEFYTLEKSWFDRLSEKAQKHSINISSLFTAHRELGGFFTGEAEMEKVARKNYEALIERSAWLGAPAAGSNPGAILRDQMETKNEGIACYLKHMKELMQIAKEKGLQMLTIEPMSCLAEPPSTPGELKHMMEVLGDYHSANSTNTVPVYYCADISHGVCDIDQNELYGNTELFEYGLPYTSEFHFKNTDNIYNSTFGFEPENLERGIVDLASLKQVLDKNAEKIPVDVLIGYLEIGGPKLGRDYSDPLLERQLELSLEKIQSVFTAKRVAEGSLS